METQSLRAFMAVATHGKVTIAAKELHVTQSALSKQIIALERELGRKLFLRTHCGMVLTEAGRLLKDRSATFIAAADRMEAELTELDSVTGGTLYFGLAESTYIRHLAQSIARLKEKCPDLRCHMQSGVTTQVLDQLDMGVLDFGTLCEAPDIGRYASILFPEKDVWGLVMPQDCDLSRKYKITIDDIIGLPLFCSAQSWKNDIPRWAGQRMNELRLEASFGLAYNGSVFVREGLGYLLVFEHLIDVSPGSGLIYRPLSPPLMTPMYLVWKRNSVLSPIAKRFLEEFEEYIGNLNLDG